MPLVEINYWAVMVATAATFALGALRYSPLLFGRLWVAVHGHTPEDLGRLRQRAGQLTFVSILCHLVVALILAVLLSLTGFGSPRNGLVLGFLCWLGFAAPLGLTGNVTSGQGIGVWFLDTGYQLASLLLMGAILGAWRQ